MATAQVQRLIAPRSFVDAYLRPRIASDKALYDPQKGHAAYVFVMELASGLFALLLDLPYNALTGSVNALYDGLKRRNFSRDYFYQHFNLAWRSSSTALRTVLLQPLWGREDFSIQLACTRELNVAFDPIKPSTSLPTLLIEYQNKSAELPLDSSLKLQRLFEIVRQVVVHWEDEPAALNPADLTALAHEFSKFPLYPLNLSFLLSSWYAHTYAELIWTYCLQRHRSQPSDRLCGALEGLLAHMGVNLSTHTGKVQCGLFLMQPQTTIGTFWPYRQFIIRNKQDAVAATHVWLEVMKILGRESTFGVPLADFAASAAQFRLAQLTWQLTSREACRPSKIDSYMTACVITPGEEEALEKIANSWLRHLIHAGHARLYWSWPIIAWYKFPKLSFWKALTASNQELRAHVDTLECDKPLFKELQGT